MANDMAEEEKPATAKAATAKAGGGNRYLYVCC